jgi:hypothetical protein
MEASRFPQAWNVLDPVRRADAQVDTLAVDWGFAQHPDLSVDTRTLCYGGTCNSDIVPNANNFHATHVSGTIGASWANPYGPTQPGQMMGVDGANPVVDLYGAAAAPLASHPGLPRPATPAWASAAMDVTFLEAIEGKADRWPDLRVVNLSLGTLVYTRHATTNAVLWGSLQGSRRCGPGDNDDGPGATGPCLPSTDDPCSRRSGTRATSPPSSASGLAPRT